MDASAFAGSLDCSICLDIFKEPLILNNCGHTVCSKCVKKLIEAPPTRRSVACPECRTVSEVPADGFKKNYRLADIIAKLAESPRESPNHARLTPMSADPTKFIGKWRFVISENHDEYLKAVGVNIVSRKTIRSMEAGKPVLGLEVNGQHWKRTITLASRTVTQEFDLDKEVEVTALNGRKKKYTYHFVGGKLILESKKIDPRDTSSKTDWHLEEGMLIVTMETETSVKARQIYERI